MLKKISQLSLISATFLGLAHFPASADTAAVQSGSQDVNISGDNNQVNQTINQTIINHPGRGSLNRSDGNRKNKTQNTEESDRNNNGNHYGSDRNHNRK